MFLTSSNNQELLMNIEKIGLLREIKNKRDVLIKINLSGVYTVNHPRTDMVLLETVVNYVYENGGRCAITEGANGYLTENLIASGFDDLLKQYSIKVIDVDSECCDEVLSYGEKHYIPKCFLDYPIRIALPAASKREGMIFSNNVKLFVGAVPKNYYQLDVNDAGQDAPRPRIHQNLHLSVANLFLAVQGYAPFQFYINGGLSYNENIGEFSFAKTFIGDNALELDCHMFQTYFSKCEHPDYLDILHARVSDGLRN